MSTMKNLNGNSVSPWLLLTVMCFASGCCTQAIWKETAGKTWKPLADPPQVWLSADGENALVAFKQQETVTKDQRKRMVACWASAPYDLAAVGQRAVQKLTNSTPSLRPLEVVGVSEPQDSTQGKPALWNTNTFELTIPLSNGVFGPRRLPSTYEERRTTDRILMTPIGLVGDAIIVAGAVALVGAACMADPSMY